MKRLLPYVLVVAVTAVGNYVLMQQTISDAATDAYHNAVQACQRGNLIRGVVYQNTVAAVRQAREAGDPQRTIAAYQANVDTLNKTPTINHTTGHVDCRVVVARAAVIEP